MRMRSVVAARKVVSSADREKALAVVEAVYRREKRWIARPSSTSPSSPTSTSRICSGAAASSTSAVS
jgi:hypothetical protein